MSDVENLIIKGATELFTKKGCKTVTMDDIANSLGISKRTIYENFKDKAELLSFCLTFLFEKVNGELEEFLESENIILSFLEFNDSSNGIIHNVCKDFFQDVKKYYPEVFKKVIETSVCARKEKTLLFLEQGVQKGYFLETLNKNIVTIMIQEIGILLGNEDAFPLRKYNKEELFRNGFVPFLRGIATDKGIATINNYYNLH